MDKKPSVNARCDELVLEMEKMLPAANPTMEGSRWSKPSIYRVPQWLEKMTRIEGVEEAYRPRLVSLGPFHNGAPDLLPMEEHKRRALLHIAKRSRKPLKDFFAAIEEVADELMDAYHDLDEKWREKERGRFVQMMVVDGCFLLEIMKELKNKKAPDDYSSIDPVFSVQGMVSLWVGIRSDMLMIENQAQEVNKLVLEFMVDPMKEGKLAEGIDGPCLHPLDIFHRSFCGRRRPSEGFAEPESSMPAASELRDAGIHFEKSKTACVNDIQFRNGVLSLPALSIYDGNKQVFLNLMAFERLHSDTGTIATDYMIFMDNIIDSERDVALLRSKGIIKNLLSSDKDAAKFINILSRGAVLSPFSRLQDVRRQVKAHCRSPWNKSIAIFRHAHLKHPWAFLSLMAAVILLIATLLQTVYTVWSFYSPNNKR
ncbi:hypothetical protein EJB05_32239, partial [Eragrostis curvula]